MDAVFYDRKHNCEVKASQLVRTNVIVDVIQGDPQDPPKSFDDFKLEIIEDADGTGEFPGRLSWWTMTVGEIGYKTPNCPSFQNWDRSLMVSDLVFLRLED